MSEFSDRLNKKIKESGLKRTAFADEELELVRKFRGLKPGNKNAVSVFISALYVQDRAENANTTA